MDGTERFRYREDGWSWAWILAAPLFCLAAGLFEWVTEAPVHWLMLTVCAIASALCHAVMIGATRVHGRVRLTATTYTQGTEDLDVDRIAEVLPPPPAPTGRFGGPARPEASWESARTLGELRDVPRRREAVGLRLDNGAEVRAWARDAAALRAALESVVAESGAGRDRGDGPAGESGVDTP